MCMCLYLWANILTCISELWAQKALKQTLSEEEGKEAGMCLYLWATILTRVGMGVSVCTYWPPYSPA